MFNLKFSHLALAVALLSLNAPAAAGDKNNKSWKTQSHCISNTRIEAPTDMSKNDIRLIGVDIGPEGEIIRLVPKADILKNLPERFVFAEQMNWLSKLSRDISWLQTKGILIG